MYRSNLPIKYLVKYFEKLDDFFPELRLLVQDVLRHITKEDANKEYPYQKLISDLRISLNKRDVNGCVIRTSYNNIPGTMLSRVTTGCVGDCSKTLTYVESTINVILKSLAVELRDNLAFKKYIMNFYRENPESKYTKLVVGNPLRYVKKNENIFTTIHDMYTNVYSLNSSAKQAHRHFYGKPTNLLPASYERFYYYWKCYLSTLHA